MRRIYEEITKHVPRGQAVVLVTVVAARGSTPRKPGTKMLVQADGRTVGTIGGGTIETEARQLAVRMLASDPTPRLAEFSGDDEATGTSCGGTLQVFLDPVLPEKSL